MSENTGSRRRRSPSRCTPPRNVRSRSSSEHRRVDTSHHSEFPPRHRDRLDVSSVERNNTLEEIVRSLIGNGRESTSERSEPTRRYRIRPDCVPKFQPNSDDLTAEKWLHKIEQLAQINEWDEKMIIYVMQSRLSGLARDWYNSLDSYNLTWTQWKELILKSFPSKQDYARKLRALLSRKKLRIESWDQYYFRKMEMIRGCDISGKNAVSCLIDGIDDSHVKTGAIAGRYLVPEKLYS
ncbi:hypothetical protein NQ317_006131 [Molorchus minor]|uniref:Retrotransposon gag domain-containing protein n=1 Tax=Molorchus minor TaxID=1323400 RepID=A0ABQ9K1K4_9CUCU|nr:hypothetical protein NQ317_006131 [Molorchus minor]